MIKAITHSGNIIIAGFVVMVLMMGALVYQCTKQTTDMVSANYYQQELSFQDNINAKSKGDEYGNAFNIKEANNAVVLQIPIALSTTIDSATATFYCAADSKNDRVLKLNKSATGEYLFNTKDWKKIAYTVKVDITSKSIKYYKQFPLIIK